MAKKVEIELDVKGNIVESTKNLRALKQQLKETAAGSAEFKKLTNQIDDLEDSLKGAKSGASDWIDSLESAPGPIGMLGKGLNGVKVAFTSFNTALKASIIGIVVTAIGGLVAAFSQSETAMKKLEPLWIGLEKILGGIMEVFQPLLDAFLEMAMTALPYITKGIGIFYSSLVSLFTLVKEAGLGVGNMLKGIFTLDFDAVTEGWNQLTGSWDKTVSTFTESMGRYEEGTKKMTKTEKENLKEGTDARQKALDERIKQLETQDKLDAATLEKEKAMALSKAQTEQEKLDIEKKFGDLIYKQNVKNIEDKQKLYKKDSQEYKNLQAEKIKLETEYINQQTGFTQKEKDLQKQKNKDLMDEELGALEMKKAQGLIKEDEYQKALKDIKVKYAEDDKQRREAEIAFANYETEQKKKKIEEERQLALGVIQDQIDELDRLNAAKENDFQQDIERLEKKKLLLQDQRDKELLAVEGDEIKKAEIRRKYAKQIEDVDKQITETKKADTETRIALEQQYADVVGQFGNFLQSVAGKNKGLAKAGLIIEQAAGVAKIIINTQANAAKAGYLSPKGIAELAAGVIGVAAAVAATVKGIKQIDAADKGTGGGGGQQSPPRGYAYGGMIGGKRHAEGGTLIEAEQGEAILTRGAVSMFKPLLSIMNQAGGGVPLIPNLVTTRYDNPSTENVREQQSPPIFKTYVVEQELTSSQQKQARLKNLSTL